MKNILCVHKVFLQNVGDFHSTPAQYFPFLKNAQFCDIQDSSLRDQSIDKVVILGGGGLLAHSNWMHELKQLKATPTRGLIGWGIGQNTHHGASLEKKDVLRHRDFTLLGIRDWGSEFPSDKWVPCASCLHPFFDQVPSPSNETVVFEHHEFRIDSKLLPEAPRLGNDEIDLRKVLTFLASGEVVVTNSYHGVYWATLMSRRVIVVDAFSDKFNYFKHPPVTSDRRDLHSAIKSAQTYPEALIEARAANNKFGRLVEDYIEQISNINQFSPRMFRSKLGKRLKLIRQTTGSLKRSLYRKPIIVLNDALETMQVGVFGHENQERFNRILVSTTYTDLLAINPQNTILPLPSWWVKILRLLGKEFLFLEDLMLTNQCRNAPYKEYRKFTDQILRGESKHLSSLLKKQFVVVCTDNLKSKDVTVVISKSLNVRNLFLVQIGECDSVKILADLDLRGRLSFRDQIVVSMNACLSIGGGIAQSLRNLQEKSELSAPRR